MFIKNVILDTSTLKKHDFSYTNFENFDHFNLVYRVLKEKSDLT